MIGVLLCIWRFLQVPAVFEALLRFCAAGEIPGTDVALSPDAVLRMVFGLSVIGALVIFYRLFLKPPSPVVDVPGVPWPLTMEQPAAAIPVAPAASRTHHLIRAGRRAWQVIIRVSIRAYYITQLVAAELWRITEPVVRRFDGWLRVVLNGYEPTARMLQFLRTVLGPSKSGVPQRSIDK